MQRSAYGFTLIEMIVVVIILGVIASIAGIQYTKAVERSRGVEAKQVLLTAYAGYQRRVADEDSVAWGQISGRWANLGMSNPNSQPNRFFDYVFSNTGGNPRLIARRNGDATKNLTVYFANGTLVVTSPY